MIRIIAFTGLPRSGKDTAARELAWSGYTQRAFATPLKEAAAALLGRSVDEMEGRRGFDREAVLPGWGFSTRWFLQRLGTECMRQQICDDFWIRRMEEELTGLESVVITDCRFQNEIDMVHAYGGKIVRIERPGCVSTGHISDKPMPYDILVHNDSTELAFREKITCLAATIWNTKRPTKSSPRSSRSGKSATKRATSSKRRAKSTKGTGSTWTTPARLLKVEAILRPTGGFGAATPTGRKAT